MEVGEGVEGAAAPGKRRAAQAGVLGCQYRRESGQLGHRAPWAYGRTIAAERGMLQRLRLERTLDGHSGCVNTVHFNPEGDVLVSGSDDKHIVLWDWQRGKQLLKYCSGHVNNVFQARVMPHSNNRTIVSCAADGQVRVGTLREGGSGRSATTVKVGLHHGRAHKLAIEPDSPNCFLSTGEDGVVRHFDLREPRFGNRSLLTLFSTNSIMGGLLGVYALAINPTRPWLFALACADERVKVYDFRWSMGGRDAPAKRRSSDRGRPSFVASYCPPHLAGNPFCHTTCVAYSHSGELLATYSNEGIYLFDADEGGGWPRPAIKSAPHRALLPTAQGSGEAAGEGTESAPTTDGGLVSSSGGGELEVDGEAVDGGEAEASGMEPTFDVASEPRSPDAGGSGGDGAGVEEVAPEGENGGEFQRETGEEAMAAEVEGAYWNDGRSQSSGLTVSPDPSGDVTDGDDDSLPDRSAASHSGVSGSDGSAEGDEMGDVDILASIGLRRAAGEGLWPGVDLVGEMEERQRDSVVLQYYYGHYNRRTVKGVNFMGPNDEYVVSGSDCGSVFIWDKFTSELLWMKTGDEAVVNCLEPHPAYPLTLATSGIDSTIKLWSPTAEESSPLDWQGRQRARATRSYPPFRGDTPTRAVWSRWRVAGDEVAAVVPEAPVEAAALPTTRSCRR